MLSTLHATFSGVYDGYELAHSTDFWRRTFAQPALRKLIVSIELPAAPAEAPLRYGILETFWDELMDVAEHSPKNFNIETITIRFVDEEGTPVAAPEQLMVMNNLISSKLAANMHMFGAAHRPVSSLDFLPSLRFLNIPDALFGTQVYMIDEETAEITDETAALPMQVIASRQALRILLPAAHLPENFPATVKDALAMNAEMKKEFDEQRDFANYYASHMSAAVAVGGDD